MRFLLNVSLAADVDSTRAPFFEEPKLKPVIVPRFATDGKENTPSHLEPISMEPGIVFADDAHTKVPDPLTR